MHRNQLRTTLNRLARRLVIRLPLPRPVATYTLWALGMPPMAGGSPGEGGSGEGGSGGEGGGSGSGEGGEGGGSGSGSGSGAGGEGGEGGGGNGSGEGSGEWTPPSREEWDNVQRRQRETADALKKIQDDQAAAERKRAEDEGRFKDVAETEKARATKLEEDLQGERRTNRGNRIAGRLNFRDPGDAIRLLPDAEVLDDDSKTEKALKDLAKSKPWLVQDGESPRQRNVTGDQADGDAKVAGTSRLARAYGSSSS